MANHDEGHHDDGTSFGCDIIMMGYHADGKSCRWDIMLMGHHADVTS